LILSTGAFALRLYVLLGFVGKTSFSFAVETLIQIMKLCIGICPEKAKQELEPLGLSLSHKTWTGE
jgi:hypothetical protein